MEKLRKLIIAVKGTSEHGKSSAIKVIADILENNSNTTEFEKSEQEGDVKVTLKYNGYKIGIESQGDPGADSYIFKSLDEFVNKNNVICDIIIIACRTRGETYDAVCDTAINNGYDMIEAPNSKFALYLGTFVNSSNTQNAPLNKYIDKLNDLFAQHVINIIDERIAGNI